MKLIPILLIGLSLIASSSALAGHHFSAENNLERINAKLAEQSQSLVKNNCLHLAGHLENTKDYNALDSRRTGSRKRILHAGFNRQQNQKNEFTSLSKKSVTPGINILSIRVSSIRSPLTKTIYSNTNRYITRAQIPARMNLQLNSQLEPVYSSVMFTRSSNTRKIPFKLPKKNIRSTNIDTSFIGLNNSELDKFVESINTQALSTINGEGKQSENLYLLSSVESTKTECTPAEKLI